MIAYLQEFMTISQFPEEDQRILCEAYRRIESNPSAAEKMQTILSMYQEDMNCDFKQILLLSGQIAVACDLHPYTTDLLTLLCLTRHAKELYAERGLSEDLFYHTMLDLRYKLEECRVVKGICGTFVGGWYPIFFRLQIFTLGRLQFERRKSGITYEKGDIKITPETEVLGLHIPRTGTHLDQASCMESFAMAKEFFKEELGEHPIVLCNSWLLYPKQREFLPSHSNILKFMDLFEIYNWSYSSEVSDLWRIFDTTEQNPDRLPVKNSLHRAYVEYLKQGGRTGKGNGLRVL